MVKLLDTMEIIHLFIYQPIFNLLYLLYSLLWNNFAIAIISLAFIVKVATIPMVNSQKRMASKQKEVAGKLKELKVTYKDDPQTLMKEQMKLQGGIGSAFGGCLMMIITIILFLQIRSTILDLTNQGWHAFNKVAYVESWKRPEDSLKFDIPKLTTGEHKISLEVLVSNKTFKQDVRFWVYSTDADKEKYKKEAETYLKSNSTSLGQLNGSYGVVKVAASDNSDVSSIYFPSFSDNFVVNENLGRVDIYFRIPFDSKDLQIKAKIDEVDITNFALTKGEMINLKYFGIDLGKTAIEVAPNGDLISNLIHPSVLPYLILAVLLGLSQFFSIKYLTPTKKTELLEAENIIEGEIIEEKVELSKTKDQKKKEKIEKDIDNKVVKEKDLAEDMAKTMEDMGSSMGWMLSVMSVITSLGILGGSHFFPSGLSIYWTAQSLFDIIKGILSNKFVQEVTKSPEVIVKQV
jgi:YidC/Oxa1 family membrane protein insertase